MTARHKSRAGGPAAPDLVILARWEEVGCRLLVQSGKWPRSARFSFARRVQDLILEIAESLVVARFDRLARPQVLWEVNLRLERLRLLLRMARQQGVLAQRPFERAARGIDEVGRMLHGWRQSNTAGR